MTRKEIDGGGRQRVGLASVRRRDGGPGTEMARVSIGREEKGREGEIGHFTDDGELGWPAMVRRPELGATVRAQEIEKCEQASVERSGSELVPDLYRAR